MIQPVDLDLGGIADANGNATIPVPAFAPTTLAGEGLWASVTFSAFAAGAPSIIVQQILGSNQAPLPIATVAGSQGSAAVGPVQLPGTLRTELLLSGMTPGAQIAVSVTGITGSADDIGSTGQTYSSVGVQQSNPANLLAGQVGPPLLENLIVTVPAVGTPFQSPTFPVSGYGALFVKVVPPVLNIGWTGQLNWMDAAGNSLSDTVIGGNTGTASTGVPALGVFGVRGAQVELELDSVAGSIAGFTILQVIPLALMPPDPSAFMENRLLISQGPNVINANGTATYDAASDWNGRAVWSCHAGGSSPSFIIELGIVNSAGGFNRLVRYADGDASPILGLVELPGGHPQIRVTNQSGSNQLTVVTSLVATA